MVQNFYHGGRTWPNLQYFSIENVLKLFTKIVVHKLFCFLKTKRLILRAFGRNLPFSQQSTRFRITLHYLTLPFKKIFWD